MNEVFNIFKELQSTKSRKAKELIIEKNKNNELFVKCISFLLDDFTKTGISKKKISKRIGNIAAESNIKDIEELMEYLSVNNTGRDKDIYIAKQFIQNNIEFKDEIEGLITKSTRLGVTAKTLNKIIPDCVKEFGVMLAESYFKNKDKVNYKDFILTTKLDGVRNIAIVEDGKVSCYSRQGQEVEGMIEIERELSQLPNGVYDGELIADIDRNIMDSKDIFAETIKRSRIKGNKKGLNFVMYDLLPLEDFYKGRCDIPCLIRKDRLRQYLNQGLKFNHISYLKPLYIGSNKYDIEKYLQEEVSKGEEGIMINIVDAPYECKRVKTLLKVKKFNDADVLVTDVIEGDGRNKGKLGAIEVKFEYKDVKYKCNVGSGFTDTDRKLYWEHPELILGKIVTIQYFEITQNDNGSYGMRFPTWINRIRDDKTEISMN